MTIDTNKIHSAEQTIISNPTRREVIKSGSLLATGIVLSSTVVNVLAAESNQAHEGSLMQAPEFNPATEYVFTITATIGAPMVMGETALGVRCAIPITGGTVEGKNIRGKIVPGGADWQRVRSDGVTELEAAYAIQLDDSTLVQVLNRGMVVPAENGQGIGYFRTAISFQAPIGAFDWLNKSIYLCRAGLRPDIANSVFIEVYRLT